MADPPESKIADKGVPQKDCVEGAAPLDAARRCLTDPKAFNPRTNTSDRSTIAAAGLPPGDGFFTAAAQDKEAAPKFPLTDKYDPVAPYRNPDGTPTARGEELSRQALDLVKGQASGDGSLSLKGHGEIMKRIADDKSLTEADKWYVYKQVCDVEGQGRDANGRLLPGTKGYRVLFGLTPPTNLEPSLKGDVVRHLIIDPTMDAYHGGLIFGSRSYSAAFLRGAAGIYMHELVGKPIEHMFQGFPIDRGDEHSSLRQLRALKAMQKGGFNGYAQVWRREFGQ
jgi:hypothetical protein